MGQVRAAEPRAAASPRSTPTRPRCGRCSSRASSRSWASRSSASARSIAADPPRVAAGVVRCDMLHSRWLGWRRACGAARTASSGASGRETTPLYRRYHDEEWGFPVADDRRLFEKLCLEGFQSGLSWLTILRKRESFRAAFAGFDFDAVARFGARDVARLLQDAGIVRHRGKIESTINNARRARQLVDERGLARVVRLAFEPAAAERPKKITLPVLLTMATTDRSLALSKALASGAHVRRPDHRLRVHAGDGPRERPRRGLCVPPAGRSGPGALPPPVTKGRKFRADATPGANRNGARGLHQRCRGQARMRGTGTWNALVSGGRDAESEPQLGPRPAPTLPGTSEDAGYWYMERARVRRTRRRERTARAYGCFWLSFSGGTPSPQTPLGCLRLTASYRRSDRCS